MDKEQLRIHTVTAGDPVSDYYGFPITQQQIIDDEHQAQDRTVTEESRVGSQEADGIMAIVPITDKITV